MHSSLLVLAAAVALITGLPRSGEAACAPAEVTGLTYTSTSLAPYNPFTSFSPKLVTVTATATHSCTVELAFLAQTSPARMSGPGLLNYDVQLPSGGTSLLYPGGTPLNTARIDIGAANTGSAVVQVSLPSGQVVADGIYGDSGLMAQVFDRNGSVFTLLKSATMPVSGSVAKVCQFTVATTQSLNFSSAIANGLPNPGHVQSVTLSGVSCTAPASVRLSGDPMQPTQAVGASPNLDTFIHYRASANFNAASTTLDTSVANAATSANKSTLSGATANGSIDVSINLLRGRPIVAGSYGATLTVTIDPMM